MATVIRLSRFGKRHHAVYRVVVIDNRKARDAEFIEQVGFYDPNLKVPDVKFDQEKVLKWLGVGAQPSDTVASLLRQQGIMDLFHELKANRSIEGKTAVVKAPKVSKKAAGPKAKARLAAEKAAKEAPAPVVEAPAEEAPTEA
ncbi:MAG TPA: 30S ribosomal protein S16 [Fibrobacter sp.]|nr:30S ribosomal protein S16 [Fibrobacter sp.]